eukprot:4415360-Prymnesium_polylepis.1
MPSLHLCARALVLRHSVCARLLLLHALQRLGQRALRDLETRYLFCWLSSRSIWTCSCDCRRCVDSESSYASLAVPPTENLDLVPNENPSESVR